MKVNKSAVFLIVTVFILIFFVTALIIELRTDPAAEIIRANNLLNVLFIIEKDGVPFSSNIITYHPLNRRGAMFDIPPETGLIIKSLSRTARIETLYKEKGREAFLKEVESLAGIEIPFYTVISFDSFAMLTDILSGINLFIPTPVDIVAGGGQDTNPSIEDRVLLPSGSVNLDGDKIRLFMTYSSAEDMADSVTLRRQHTIMAFLRALNDNNSFAFSGDIFPLIASCFTSNASGESFRTILSGLSQIDVERLTPRQMHGMTRIVDGEEMLFPFYDGNLFREVIAQTFSAFLSENASEFERIYTIEILNGTETQGLARRTSELYQGFGYDIVNVGNALTTDYSETVVIDRIGSSSVASAVADIIQCSNIEVVQTPVDTENAAGATEYSVDFTIILGNDFNGRYVISR